MTPTPEDVARYGSYEIMWSQDGHEPKPSPEGQWVRFADYEALAARLAEVEAERESASREINSLTAMLAARLAEYEARVTALTAELAEAAKKLAETRETLCYASPGTDEEFTSLLLGFDTAAGIICDLATGEPK